MEDLLGLNATPFTLTTWQMLFRGTLVFLITVAFVRLSGMRTFGAKTAFDAVISIMLGAILSRAIVAASPFFPTLLTGLLLATFHRLLAYFSIYNEKLGDIVKGEQRLLVKNGEIIWPNLERSNLSEQDLIGGIRKNGVASLSEVKEAYIERSGEISVLPYRAEKD
jgi:uncharacterized membrane protein YcaP (DUF421 family)